MLDLLRKQKEDDKPIIEVTPRDVLFVGSAIEILREMKEKVDRIDFRLRELERKFDERVSEKVLSESKFVQDTSGSEDIVNKIITEVKKVARPLIPHKEKITIVESKRIERAKTCKNKIKNECALEKSTGGINLRIKFSAINWAALAGESQRNVASPWPMPGL